jgi:hypothetical protein
MAATFTTLVTSFCEKLEAAQDIAEFDALDLTIESDYSRFRSPVGKNGSYFHHVGYVVL